MSIHFGVPDGLHRLILPLRILFAPNPGTKLLAAVAVSMFLFGSGCAHTQTESVASKPVVPPTVPNELSKAALPDYVIEPPDVLTISGVNLTPRQPYRLKPLDVVLIQAPGVPQEVPLAGEFTIGPDGQLVLGFDYDYVDAGINAAGEPDRVFSPIVATGLTTHELRERVERRVAQVAKDPRVWLTLGSIAAQQEIAGEHLVAPDGKVTLGAYGRVCVVGMTIPEAKQAIESHLASSFEAPEVAVDVFGFNSKAYYVITQGAGLGDGVQKFPIKGNETALDAISELQGLPATASTCMWIARPGFNEHGGDQILPVDWAGITQRGDIRTNYQLMPGDRLYVSEDKLIAFDSALAKRISPVERVMAVVLLGTQTLRSIIFFDEIGNLGLTGGI